MATDEFEKGNEKIAWIMTGIILIITVVLIGTLLWSTHQDAQSGNAYEIRLEDDCIGFDGITADLVKFKDIKEIKLLEKLPHGMKSGGGIGTNELSVGDFKFDEIGKCRAYLYNDKSPYIYLKTDKVFLFNQFNPSDTRELYNEIKKQISHKQK